MSAVPAPGLVSIRDYLDAELHANEKHEYLGGVIHAMAGATKRHDRVAGRVYGGLLNRLRGSACEPLGSEVKIRVQSTMQTRFYYPDAMVVCDTGNDADAVFEDHPVVIVEVLSPSTRRIDEGEKRDSYLTIPSLRAYLLVEPTRPSVRVDRRGDFGFTQELYEGLDAEIPLPEVGIGLPLRELYEN